jgi:HSP20 family molecular chaperone IbpA
MSLFPRFEQEISPIFQLMNEYDRAFRQPFRGASHFRTFSPKFDVKELKDAYELHGELPGIDQKNVNIEWTDGNTLTISGRTEHRYEAGSPQGFIEGEANDKHEYHKPTVEEEGGDANKQKSTAVAKTGSKEVAQQTGDEAKYWVTERSVGEFSRSFSFPSRVDQDNVKASLKNGILSIVVPKAKAPTARKVEIGSD